MSVFALSYSRLTTFLLLVGVGTLVGCDASSIFVNQNFGLANGATIGSAVAGNEIADNDQPPAEAIAALAGGVIGNKVGKNLSQSDRQKALKAEFEALEYSPAGQSVKWGKSVFGNSGVVVASHTYDVGLSNCRQYVHTMKVNGITETARGTACKEQDGNWVPLT